MTTEQSTKLKESIEHWTRLTTGTQDKNEGVGPQHCALCKLYFERDCVNCPVAQKTGCPFCDHTPYDEAFRSFRHFGAHSPEFQKAAKDELDFLISLKEPQ